MQLVWDKISIKKIGVAILVGALFSAAQTEVAESGMPESSAMAAIPVDSAAALLSAMEAAPDTTARDTTTLESTSVDSIAPVADSIPTPPLQQSQKPKTTLYLGGGENSVWFYLGALYAIESYRIPVDSIVGTSWGAFVGALWAKGVPLDDIQRILLDPYASPVVGRNEWAASSRQELQASQKNASQSPVSISGMPALRQRFVLQTDASGNLYKNPRSLQVDSSAVQKNLSHLRLQESLYRQPRGYVIPFAVQGCEGLVGNSPADIFNSLPLQENSKSGEFCPYLALPVEESIADKSIILVADPIRSSPSDIPWMQPILQRAYLNLENQSGIVVRPHSIQDTSRNALIQSGFSALERRLSEIAAIQGQNRDYSIQKTSAKPWFKFNPTLDSLSAELHTTVKSYWNPADTGLAGPENFAFELLNRPMYDSLKFKMMPSGDVMVSPAVHPTFDMAAGGFGSNVLGPNLYGEAAMSYVNQMEIELTVGGFWGGKNYGVMPKLQVSRLWQKNWMFSFGYDWIKLEPLRSYFTNESRSLQIYSEKRSDITMEVGYRFDRMQSLSLQFLLGNRTFDLPSWIVENEIETRPISPNLHYEFSSQNQKGWFAVKGLDGAMNVGMQSIGYDDGLAEVIPIYYKVDADVQYRYSPKPFLTFGIGAAGAVDMYHEEGYGYKYPQSFGIASLDNYYRPQAPVTPWSGEWVDVNLASHHYALARVNLGIHRNGSGLWLFGAYLHDFEENPTSTLEPDRIVLEPALRLGYRSLSIYLGMSKIVDTETADDLTKFNGYRYFVRIGDYRF